MPAPKCFVSYSWDTPAHEEWVLALASKLRESGVEAWLDKFELKLGHDLAQFMERAVREADFVLLVCTPKFAAKADGGQGGVGYEKQIVTGEIFNGAPAEKFVPLLRAGETKAALPSYLKSKLFVDFRDDARFAASLEQLLRHVFNEPLHAAPPVGARPRFGASPSAPASPPQVARGISTLFSESFDDAPDDDGMRRRYGDIWLIGRDGAWAGSVRSGRWELENASDPGAVHYSYIDVSDPDGAAIDANAARITVRVQVDGGRPDPFAAAGVLLRFDAATRHYGAFAFAQLDAHRREPPMLIWVVRDADGFRVAQRVPAPWLEWDREVLLTVETRAGELHCTADGREAFSAPANFLPGRSTGLIAIGRGRFAFDDFRVVAGL